MLLNSYGVYCIIARLLENKDLLLSVEPGRNEYKYFPAHASTNDLPIHADMLLSDNLLYVCIYTDAFAQFEPVGYKILFPCLVGYHMFSYL